MYMYIHTLMPQLGNLTVIKVAELALLPAKLTGSFSSLKELSAWSLLQLFS